MADIIERRGNIFTTSCEVLALTVNCEGVMGAGIALEGRLRWPEMFNVYEAFCASDGMKPGVLLWWGPDERGTRVLCFPTKAGWKQPSRLEFINKGLRTLASEYRGQGVNSIAMPHLGCSHGGLTWDQVLPAIQKELAPLDELTVELWEFDSSAADPDFDHLVEAVANRTPEEVGQRLGLDKRAVNALLTALSMPRVVSLASLQSARGIGEKTLQKIYDYLFRRDEDEHQQSLW